MPCARELLTWIKYIVNYLTKISVIYLSKILEAHLFVKVELLVYQCIKLPGNMGERIGLTALIGMRRCPGHGLW